eukprot:3940263-Rhodomonas_salina.3
MTRRQHRQRWCEQSDNFDRAHQSDLDGYTGGIIQECYCGLGLCLPDGPRQPNECNDRTRSRFYAGERWEPPVQDVPAWSQLDYYIYTDAHLHRPRRRGSGGKVRRRNSLESGALQRVTTTTLTAMP